MKRAASSQTRVPARPAHCSSELKGGARYRRDAAEIQELEIEIRDAGYNRAKENKECTELFF